MLTDIAKLLIEGMKAWVDNSERTRLKAEKRAAAIDTVEEAALATQAYLHETETAQIDQDRQRERELSQLWRKASSAIENYDYQLAENSRVKALGWADPNQWKQAELPEAKLNVALLLEQCK